MPCFTPLAQFRSAPSVVCMRTVMPPSVGSVWGCSCRSEGTPVQKLCPGRKQIECYKGTRRERTNQKQAFTLLLQFTIPLHPETTQQQQHQQEQEQEGRQCKYRHGVQKSGLSIWMPIFQQSLWYGSSSGLCVKPVWADVGKFRTMQYPCSQRQHTQAKCRNKHKPKQPAQTTKVGRAKC